MLLDFEKVREVLPHSYPFLLVDKVKDLLHDKSIHAIKNISGNESIFQGHFPEKAIYPGVLMVESLAQASGILLIQSLLKSGESYNLFYLAGCEKTRFRKQVVPGDVLHLFCEVDKSRSSVWKFITRAEVDGQTCCECNLTLVKADDGSEK